MDDLQALAEIDGLMPPHTTTGRVLVTTRRRDAALRGHGRHLIEVGLFTPAESQAYLAGKVADQPRLAAGAEELAEELGHLPLALAQAAAYLLDRGLTCAEYLARFRDRRRSLSDVLPEHEALPDEHRATVATAWSLSVDLADLLTPAGLARPLLDVASLLAPNGIPLALFTAPPTLAYLAERRRGKPSPLNRVKAALTRRIPPSIEPEHARDGLNCLHRLNLVNHDPTVPHLGVQIHALVQRATREQLDDSALAALAPAIADALHHVWPEIERDHGLTAALRANTMALHENSGAHLWRPSGHGTLWRVGDSLGQSGQSRAAVEYFQQLEAAAAHHCGAGSPNTASIRIKIAHWRGVSGDAQGAVAVLEDLLAAVRNRTIQPDAYTVKDIAHSLAGWRGEAGDAAGAAAMYEQLVLEWQRDAGRDDRDTLALRSGLARWRGRAGDSAAAVTAFEELLADLRRIYPEDHPAVISGREDLAYWRGQAGDPAAAVADHRDILSAKQRIYGPDHPETLRTRNNYAHWQGHCGNHSTAVALYEDLLQDFLRIHGSDHTHTLSARNNLAYWRGRAGEPGRAAAEFNALLADRLRVNGPDHPATLTTRFSLAKWTGEAGNPTAALGGLRNLLPEQERILGSDHPDTRRTRDELTRWQAAPPE
ncbi:tetratricopeptide repeat protein [Actinokineospora sp. NPDC004072]